MKSQALQSIEGVEIYPIISMIIFLSLFGVALWYTVKLDTSFIRKMAGMPLVNDQNDSHEEA